MKRKGAGFFIAQLTSLVLRLELVPVAWSKIQKTIVFVVKRLYTFVLWNILHVQAFSFRFLNTLLSLLLFGGALKQTQFPSVQGRLLLCHRHRCPCNMHRRVFCASQTTTVNLDNRRISSIFFNFIYLFSYSTESPTTASIIREDWRLPPLSRNNHTHAHTHEYIHTYLEPEVNRIPTKT